MRSYKHSAAPERGTSQDYRPLQTFRCAGAGNLTRLLPSTNIPLRRSGEPHKTIALYKHSAPLERGTSQDYCPLQTFRSAGAGILTRLLPSTNIPLRWSGDPHKTIALYKHSAPLERGTSQNYCPTTDIPPSWSGEPHKTIALLQTFRSAGAGNLTKLLPYYKHSAPLERGTSQNYCLTTNIPLRWSGEPHKTIALLQTFRSAVAGNLTKLLPYYKHSAPLERGTSQKTGHR